MRRRRLGFNKTTNSWVPLIFYSIGIVLFIYRWRGREGEREIEKRERETERQRQNQRQRAGFSACLLSSLFSFFDHIPDTIGMK